MKNYFLIILLLTLSTNACFNVQTLDAEQIFQKVKDAVVTIYVYDVNQQLVGQASGVVIDDTGYIVTNYHAYGGRNYFLVKYKDKTYNDIDIYSLDAQKDILIIKVNPTSGTESIKTFNPIDIGDSDKLKTGEKIYAIGSPGGLENTISEGIISGLRNKQTTSTNLNNYIIKNYIQITAPISSGSSGGAVVNTKGELIGISTFIMEKGQNLNFAIPINEVLKIFNKKNSNIKNNIEYENYFSKGLEAHNKGNYDEAILYYQKVINLNPGYFKAYYNLAQVYYSKGEYMNALNNFQNALEIDTQYIYAYYYLALCYGRLLDYDNAIINFKKAIKLNPQYSNAYHSLASAYVQKGEYQTAIENYKYVLQLNPRDANCYYSLGVVYNILDDHDKAIHSFTKAIEINPNEVEYFQSLGIAYDKKGEYDQAINSITKGLLINDQLIKNYIQTAKQYEALIHKKNKQSAIALYNVGLVYFHKKHYDGAIISYNKAIQYDSTFAEPYHQLSDIYKIKGDYRKAEYYKEKAERLASLTDKQKK